MTHNNGTYMFMLNSLGAISNVLAPDVPSLGATILVEVIPRGPDAPKLFGTTDWQMESFRCRLASVGCEECHLTGDWRWKSPCWWFLGVESCLCNLVIFICHLGVPSCWHIFLAQIFCQFDRCWIVDMLAYFVKFALLPLHITMLRLHNSHIGFGERLLLRVEPGKMWEVWNRNEQYIKASYDLFKEAS